jgi:peroxiredoxin
MPLQVGLPLLVLAAVAATIVLLSREDGGALDTTAGSLPFNVESGGLGPQDRRAPERGEPAPEFTLLDLEGKPVRLSDLRGKPVLLNFWATWCTPCKKEMPEIEAAYRTAGEEFAVLAVNVEGANPDTARSLSRDFLAEFELTLPVLLDTPTGDVAGQYRLKGLPASFFVDRDGIMREIVIGPVTERSVEKSMAPLLAR